VESINSPLCRTGTQLSTFMVGLLPLGFWPTLALYI
jgi:hypothetical protein